MFRFLTALIAAVFVCGQANAGFAGERTIVFENQTLLTINELYISKAGAGDWQKELLDGQLVPAGQIVSVPLAANSGLNDILLIFDDGSRKVYFGLNFNLYDHIKLSEDRAELIEKLSDSGGLVSIFRD